MTTGSLTVLFEDPFRVGVFEMTDENGFHVCKVTFGAEPTGQEIIEFVEKNGHKLNFLTAEASKFTGPEKNPWMLHLLFKLYIKRLVRNNFDYFARQRGFTRPLDDKPYL